MLWNAGLITGSRGSVSRQRYKCVSCSWSQLQWALLGMTIFSLMGYDNSNANALIMEGLLESLSSGIPIYMALVNLTMVDFFHNKLIYPG